MATVGTFIFNDGKEIEVDDMRHYVRSVANHMVDFAVKEFRLDREFAEDFKVRTRATSTLKRGKASWGGVKLFANRVEHPYISILITRGWFVGEFYEYSHYANDPVIGNFKFTDWRKYAMAIVAHEISHCIQHCINYGAYDAAKLEAELGVEYEGKHGACFQAIYRVLREELVNNKPVIKVAPRRKKRARKINDKVIGKVRIYHGVWRDIDFWNVEADLVKDFQEHGGKHPYRKYGDGFITVKINNHVVRINVLESRFERVS